MENRAQVIKPYSIDMFTALLPGTLVTFDELTKGHYKVMADNSPAQLVISKEVFSQHFKFYVQTKLF